MTGRLKAAVRRRFPGLPARVWFTKQCLRYTIRLDGWWAKEYATAALRGVEPLQRCEYPLFARLGGLLTRNKAEWGLIDVGATNGVFTSALLRFFPGLAASVNFEPRRGCEANHLATRVRYFRYFPEAAGDEPGRLNLTEYGTGGLSSLLTLQPDYQYTGDTHMVGQYEVDVVRLDDRLLSILPESGVKNWVLKIDTQGSELSVLRGAENLLASGIVKVVVAELMTVEKYTGQATYLPVMAHLVDRGFELFFLQDKYYEPTGQLSEFDVIAAHRSILGPIAPLVNP